MCVVCAHARRTQRQGLFNFIVTRLGDPISNPTVDLAELLPRQQWLLWYVFHTDEHKRCALVAIASPGELMKMRGDVATPSVEHRSMCPEDTFEEFRETLDLAMDLKNGSTGVQQPDAGQPPDSDAISHNDDDDDNDKDVSELDLFGEELDETGS